MSMNKADYVHPCCGMQTPSNERHTPRSTQCNSLSRTAPPCMTIVATAVMPPASALAPNKGVQDQPKSPAHAPPLPHVQKCPSLTPSCPSSRVHAAPGTSTWRSSATRPWSPGDREGGVGEQGVGEQGKGWGGLPCCRCIPL